MPSHLEKETRQVLENFSLHCHLCVASLARWPTVPVPRMVTATGRSRPRQSIGSCGLGGAFFGSIFVLWGRSSYQIPAAPRPAHLHMPAPRPDHLSISWPPPRPAQIILLFWALWPPPRPAQTPFSKFWPSPAPRPEHFSIFWPSPAPAQNISPNFGHPPRPAQNISPYFGPLWPSQAPCPHPLRQILAIPRGAQCWDYTCNIRA